MFHQLDELKALCFVEALEGPFGCDSGIPFRRDGAVAGKLKSKF